YPSPAEKYIYVDSDSWNKSEIIITNILGQVVKDISFEGTRTSIDVADFKSGIYFVKSGDSVVKFVKL
ncbi:MAG: T9SS type A sorting domain-containing protein, partial [Bacteroidales bacterium]|nr:T9SS type A sorting domain-containing protein [Bacteroidales bacterium]